MGISIRKTMIAVLAGSAVIAFVPSFAEAASIGGTVGGAVSGTLSTPSSGALPTLPSLPGGLPAGGGAPNLPIGTPGAVGGIISGAPSPALLGSLPGNASLPPPPGSATVSGSGTLSANGMSHTVGGTISTDQLAGGPQMASGRSSSGTAKSGNPSGSRSNSSTTPTP